ncbi:MAG: CPBP family glutamic-type intramembrane protease [Bacteroidota bacterium]
MKTSLDDAWKAYTGETNKRFYEFSQLSLIIILYELLSSLAFGDRITAYGQDDIWFRFFHQYFPLARIALELFVIGVFGRLAYMDWFGIPDKIEAKKLAEENKKNRNKKPKKKTKFRDKVNWYYWLFNLIEGFVYGALIYIALKYVIFFLLQTFIGEVTISTPLDTNPILRNYQTNILQDIAFSIGSGFYEEVIFRLLIFTALLFLSKRFKLFKDVQTTNHRMDTAGLKLEFKIPKFESKQSGALSMILFACLLYSLSHSILPFSDFFGVYPLLFRFFFALIMYRIFVWRQKISIVIWTHIMYNFLYFSFA